MSSLPSRDELAVLAALTEYGEWHSAAWLTGKGLIGPGTDFAAAASRLVQRGLAARRDSDRKGPMYRISPAGKSLLADLRSTV